MPVVPPAAVTPGSDLYYALLYLPAGPQRALAAVELAGAAISSVVLECSDPGIARLRLAWWQEELARLDAGEPSHETTRALLAAGLPQPAGTALQPIVDATGVLLGAHAALSEDRFDAQLAGLSDPRWSLSMAALEHIPEEARRAGLALMRLREAALLLLDARRYLERGVVALPAWSDAPPLDADEMLAGGAAIDAQLAARAAALRADLQLALQRRPPAVPLTVLVLARITEATLAEVLRDGCALLQRRVALTPVRKLGIAWRSALGRRLLLSR